jgi:hypothetical protein
MCKDDGKQDQGNSALSIDSNTESSNKRVKAIKTTGEVKWFDFPWEAEEWLDDEGNVD